MGAAIFTKAFVLSTKELTMAKGGFTVRHINQAEMKGCNDLSPKTGGAKCTVLQASQ